MQFLSRGILATSKERNSRQKYTLTNHCYKEPPNPISFAGRRRNEQWIDHPIAITNFPSRDEPNPLLPWRKLKHQPFKIHPKRRPQNGRNFVPTNTLFIRLLG